MRTLVKKLACIFRHSFLFFKAAVRTRDLRNEYNLHINFRLFAWCKTIRLNFINRYSIRFLRSFELARRQPGNAFKLCR
jgi:hypothetical protein